MRCSSGEYEGLDFVVDPQFRGERAHASFGGKGLHAACMNVRWPSAGSPSPHLRPDCMRQCATNASMRLCLYLRAEQFSISQPTERYQRLWGQLPEEWVGTHARLLPLVQMMCAEVRAPVGLRVHVGVGAAGGPASALKHPVCCV